MGQAADTLRDRCRRIVLHPHAKMIGGASGTALIEGLRDFGRSFLFHMLMAFLTTILLGLAGHGLIEWTMKNGKRVKKDRIYYIGAHHRAHALIMARRRTRNAARTP